MSSGQIDAHGAQTKLFLSYNNSQLIYFRLNINVSDDYSNIQTKITVIADIADLNRFFDIDIWISLLYYSYS